MKGRFSKRTILGLVLLAVILALVATALNARKSSAPMPKNTPGSAPVAPQAPKPTEPYEGDTVTIADTFTVRIPHGWTASIADTGNFRGVMFAQPEQLPSLVYDADKPSTIERNGFPVPTKLTEHFFVLVPAATQAFNPANHSEVSSEPFTFDDGTVGTKYYVVKHSDEAKQYGGLIRDSEWQGRTYIYEKNGARVEAHLALYPSSTIDKSFYESVIRSITLK